MAQANIQLIVSVIFKIKQEFLPDDYHLVSQRIGHKIEIIPETENYDAYFSVHVGVEGKTDNEIQLEMRGNAKLVLAFAQQYLSGCYDED